MCLGHQAVGYLYPARGSVKGINMLQVLSISIEAKDKNSKLCAFSAPGH